MPPITEQEAQDILQKFAKRESELKFEDASLGKKIELAEKVIRYAWVVGSLIVAITVWVVKQQFDGAATTLKMIELTNRIEHLEKDHYTDTGTITEIRNTIDGNKKERIAALEQTGREIATLKEMIPKVNEMWFMKDHGITNNEEYERIHGKKP